MKNTEYVGIKHSCAAEYKLLRLRELPVQNNSGDQPDKCANFWRTHIASAQWYDESKECFCVMFLNTRRAIIGFNLVSIGSLDSCVAGVREVFAPALVAGAHAIVVGHNHPSGDPSPSDADIRVTRELLRAGQMLRVELLDHIIIGVQTPDRPGGYTSLRSMGCMF